MNWIRALKLPLLISSRLTRPDHFRPDLRRWHSCCRLDDGHVQSDRRTQMGHQVIGGGDQILQRRSRRNHQEPATSKSAASRCNAKAATTVARPQRCCSSRSIPCSCLMRNKCILPQAKLSVHSVGKEDLQESHGRAACVSLPVRCDFWFQICNWRSQIHTGGLSPNGSRFNKVDLTLRVRQAAICGHWHSSLGE